MKYTLENQTLTLYFSGEINSSNADEIEQNVDSILSSSAFSTVLVDLGEVPYVSSAGLRIFVRIRQQCDDVSLINAPGVVYEVLEMVGLPNLMRVEKKKD